MQGAAASSHPKRTIRADLLAQNKADQPFRNFCSCAELMKAVGRRERNSRYAKVLVRPRYEQQSWEGKPLTIVRCASSLVWFFSSGAARLPRGKSEFYTDHRFPARSH